MRLLFILLLSLTTSLLMAQTKDFGEFKECGEYHVAGIFRVNEKDTSFDYVIHEGSKSEIKIKLNMNELPLAAPYINRPSLVRALFVKPIDKQLGEFKILEVHARIPDPIKGAKDSGFNLIKANKCL